MRVAGLSIEGSEIRASFASRRFGAVKQLGTDKLTLPSEPVERNGVFTEALGKWKSTYGIEGVVVGLGLGHFSHRFVELPVRSKEDVRNALQFEMEKHLPLKPDLYSIDFHTIKSTGEGTKNLVLALRKEKLRWIAECLDGAGLKFYGVRCSAMEAANELLETAGVSDAVMVQQWEGAYHIIGFKDSEPEFLRLARNSEEAAHDIERLSGTIGKTVYVVGNSGTSEFERFALRSLPVNMADLVAVSTLKKRRISMDFVPEEFAAPRKDYYPYAIGILCAVCVAIFFASSIFAYVKDYSALNRVRSRTAEIKASTTDLIEMNREIETNMGKLRFLYDFRNSKNRKIEVVSQLSRLLPKDAWLISLSADESGKVEIEGFAKRAADIIGPIERSEIFKNVEFSSPVTVKEGLERFSLKMQIEEE